MNHLRSSIGLVATLLSFREVVYAQVLPAPSTKPGDSSPLENHSLGNYEWKISTTSPCSILTQSVFNTIAPSAVAPYTYQGFCNAVTNYNVAHPSEGVFNMGDEMSQRQELAAFFGHTLHESGEFTAARESVMCADKITSNNGEVYCKPCLSENFNWSDKTCSASLVTNGLSISSYCDLTKTPPDGCTCAAVTQDTDPLLTGYVNANELYFGRGAIQLSWNYNYIRASLALTGDSNTFCANPDLVATNEAYAWGAGLWFWMENVKNSKTCHQSVLLHADYGETLDNINGGLECNPVTSTETDASIQRRLNHYCRAATALGVDRLLSMDGCYDLFSQIQTCSVPSGLCSACGAWLNKIGLTARPTSSPTKIPTTVPSSSPTKIPTAVPTSSTPTLSPIKVPTAVPSSSPTKLPTASPTSSPTAPTSSPTKRPTASPTASPTNLPTAVPSPSPTKKPSASPTSSPTAPTSSPTKRPTNSPTASPTNLPTDVPSPSPTKKPSASPTSSPTAPTSSPTKKPSISPTSKPSSLPTKKPTAISTTGSGKYYADYDASPAKCAKDCDTNSDPQCGGIVANAAGEQTFDDVETCCSAKFGWMDQSRCKALTTGSSTNKWYVDYQSNSCKQDCPVTANSSCGGSPPDLSMTLFNDAAACCSSKLSWIQSSTCQSTSTTGSSTPTGTLKYYAAYSSGTCKKDCAVTVGSPECGGILSNSVGETLFDTATACCSAKFNWMNSDLCLAKGAGGYSGKFYVDYQSNSCKQDCAIGTNNCGGNPSDLSMQLFDTAESCCSSKLQFVVKETCVSKSTTGSLAAAKGTLKWYVDWSLSKCVKDCPISTSDSECGGLAETWESAEYTSWTTCCSTKLFWIVAADCHN